MDARTGAPLADVAVIASGSPKCEAVETRTDAEGRFFLADPCRGAVLVSADPHWTVVDNVPASAGAALRAWPGPPAEGVALVTGPRITVLHTNTGLDAWGDALLPVEIPGNLPRVGGDTVLAIRGLPELTWAPLVPTETQKFGTVEIGPWFRLGEPVEARVTEAGPLRYVAGDALAPGTWALVNPQKTRAFLIEMGG